MNEGRVDVVLGMMQAILNDYIIRERPLVKLQLNRHFKSTLSMIFYVLRDWSQEPFNYCFST